MPWTKEPVSAPISDAIKDAVDTADTIVSILSPILAIAEAALEVAKVFLHRATDPAAALFDAITQQLENFINDFFGSGVFVLEVNPFHIQAISAVVPGAAGGPAPIIGRYDDFGIPLMTPSDCISAMIASFNDAGDVNKPVFSNEADVVCFGFIITAPSIEGFLALIDAFMAVFSWPGFDLLRTKIRKHITPVQPSTYPDWIGWKLNSIQQMKDIQDALLELINTLRGYRDILNNVFDLINMLETKIKTLQAILQQFKNKLDTLKNAADAAGIYVFDFPLQTGGVVAVQQALSDPYLQSICTIDDGYTAGLLLFGGGPSAQPINTIKSLVI